MGLVDELRNRNGNSSSFSGGMQTGRDASGEIAALLPLINSMRDRQMSDYKQKAQFNSDLSLRQQNLQRVLAQREESNKPMNVVFKDNHPDVTPLQQEELGMKKQELGMKGKELGLQTAELGQKTKIENAKLGMDRENLDLDKKKNDQIFNTKQADMQRKIEDSNNKLALAYEQLNNKNINSDQTIKAHQAIQDALKERHALEMANKEATLNENIRLHSAQIKDMQDKLDASKNTQKIEEVNPEQTKRITTTSKGAPSGRIQVIGPVDPATGKPRKGTMDASELKEHPGWSAVQ